MSIFVDESTKVVVQGLTGSQGRFHGLRNHDYGTQVVAGVTPGKGGTDVEGVPVFDTMGDAVAATGADTSSWWSPPRSSPAAILEAASSGVPLHRVRHRGHPRPGRGPFLQRLEAGASRGALLGPNCPGVITPGKCNIGITSGDIALPSGPVAS